MKLHQLVHTLSYGDAISGEVLALQRCLTKLGFESEIFSINTHPKYKGMARDFRDFPITFDGEVLLHYSLGSPLNDLYRSLKSATRSLVYHNLTPAHWFRSVNPRIVADIERGLSELPELCRISDRLIADSAFNAGELKSLGFDARVLPLPIDTHKWDVPTNPGFYSQLKDDPALHVLHVGRMAPNKCVEDIIKSFYFLQKYVHSNSKLWLVGIDIDTEVYSFGLKRLAQQLGIDEHVRFIGQRDDGELKALYQTAHVYMCMSEHEGFCLPVVEAMHFGLPVLSFASSALPETIGAAGILVHEKRHPEIAELTYELYSNAEMRKRLIDAGHKRVTELSVERFSSRVEELFATTARRQPVAVLQAKA
ncbi:MAG: glycosyltransferase family 4 protein [Deltaproteobacteria bacterium]|nr:glycosyltransferase family 4 protein [Deltaproteobacteria bacterium]